jgi:ubiquinone/menaquinone biosynthesis C-methylase UbiE
VQLNSIHCTTCGFTCYSPRPNDDDIARKYKYLKKYEPDIGGQSGHDLYASKLDSKRAARIYDKCMEYISSKELYILDYGGGNGKLMTPFLENKHKCHIIDYNDKPLPGISKIGNDINNYQTDVKYDVIICSHSLEHVAEISSLIKRLRGVLKAEGIIYAEVPQEIWAGLRIDADPVTHINYFAMNSFSNLFLSNGFDVLEKKEQVSNYSKTYMEVIWVVARKNSTNTNSLIASNTNERLYPSRPFSLITIFRLLIQPKIDKFLNF